MIFLARSTPVERLPWQTGKQQAWIINSVAMSPQFEDVTNGIYMCTIELDNLGTPTVEVANDIVSNVKCELLPISVLMNLQVPCYRVRLLSILPMHLNRCYTYLECSIRS
jgi:hypothetical protein